MQVATRQASQMYLPLSMNSTQKIRRASPSEKLVRVNIYASEAAQASDEAGQASDEAGESSDRALGKSVL
jgi:hypothetical protein